MVEKFSPSTKLANSKGASGATGLLLLSCSTSFAKFLMYFSTKIILYDVKRFYLVVRT